MDDRATLNLPVIYICSGSITDLPGTGPAMAPVVLGPFTADYYGIKSAGAQIVKW